MLGGLRLLAPISLRLMADSCQVVREAAAISFRNFVPLMTLKAVSFLYLILVKICVLLGVVVFVLWRFTMFLLLESKNRRTFSSEK